MSAQLNYRPDIDGLRAVAVLGVVLFHAGLGVPGGYVGVDIFFVISGFLITGIILKDLERGTFSMLAFWERRARRIFPALAVVVAVCLIVGWFLMLPFGYLVLAQSAVALSFFASNIQFWRTGNYFGPVAEENLLLHTWSLSVEEQFYLIVPISMAVLYAWRKRSLLPWAAAAGVGVSLLISIWWLHRDPSGAFYLLPSRGWELASGSLLAFARPYQLAFKPALAAGGGLLLILASYVFYSEKTAFPGLAAVPPVLGAALIIWSGNAVGSVFHKVLAWRPLVHVGLLSYSLYLWHWPLFALHRYLVGGPPSIAAAIGYVALALVLSELSLRFVERPFRERKWAATRRRLFTAYFASSALLLAACLAIYTTGGVPTRLPETVARLDRVAGDEAFTGRNVTQFPEGGRSLEFGTQAAKRSVLLWGDSHASVALWALDPLCRELNLAGVAFTRGATPPVFQWSGERDGTNEHASILKHNERVTDFISGSHPPPEFAVLVFRWTRYVPRDRRLVNMTSIPEEGFGDALIETASMLINQGLKVAVVLEPPVFSTHIPKKMAMHEWRGFSPPSLTLSQHKQFNEDYAEIVAGLRQLVPDVVLIDPQEAFLKDGMMQFRDADGILLFRDEHHLTPRGVSRLLPAFKEFFDQ